MKVYTLTILMILATFSISGQNVGIGTTSPDASAALEVSSTDKGLLIPRVERAAVNAPAEGLLIFQPSNKSFYYYDGAQWLKMGIANEIVDEDGDTKVSAVDALAGDSIHFTVNGNRHSSFISNANQDVLIDLESTGNNTFIGEDSGFLNTGYRNTAVGSRSLRDNTFGSSNLALGVNALQHNTSGADNIAIGFNALLENYIGHRNIAIGTESLKHNKSSFNTGVGNNSLKLNTIGYDNSAFGDDALRNNVSGNNNVAIGVASLGANFSGSNNTALGGSALFFNTTGSQNIAIGNVALFSNTDKSKIVAVGDSALYSNGISANASQAIKNTAVGSSALKLNSIGSYNTSIGYHSLQKNTSGNSNVALGTETLLSNTGGSHNVAIGNATLAFNTDRSHIVAVGDSALYKNGEGAIILEATKNTAVGTSSQKLNTTGSNNTSLGYHSLKNNISGYNNVSIGTEALLHSNGQSNVALGNNTLLLNPDGDFNVAVGAGAAFNSTGSENLFLGYRAGYNSTGSGNIFLGNEAGYNETGANKLYISNDNSGQYGTLMYGEFDNRKVQINGSLGLGGTYPEKLLDVVGKRQLARFFSFDIDESAYIGFHNYADGFDSYIGADGFGFSGVKNQLAIATWTAHPIKFFTNQIERIVLDADGDFGVGTSTPGARLEVKGSNPGSPVINILNNDSDTIFSVLENNNVAIGKTSGSTLSVRGIGNDISFLKVERTNGVLEFEINDTRSVFHNHVDIENDLTVTGTFTNPSDIRLKENILPLKSSISALLKMGGYTFKWKDPNKSKDLQFGVIAQEVQKVYPHLVVEQKDGTLAVNYIGLIPVLIEATKEQQEIIDQQAKKIEQLNQKLLKFEGIDKRLDQLEKNLK